MTTTGTSGEPFRGVLDAAVEHERTPHDAFPDVGYPIGDRRTTGTYSVDDGSGHVQHRGVPPGTPPEA
jgi:hypothetical protein